MGNQRERRFASTTEGTTSSDSGGIQAARNGWMDANPHHFFFAPLSLYIEHGREGLYTTGDVLNPDFFVVAVVRSELEVKRDALSKCERAARNFAPKVLSPIISGGLP